MAPNILGMHDAIDLTGDTDDDEEPPEPLPVPQINPKKIPAPLPFNVRHLYSPPPANSKPIPTPTNRPSSADYLPRSNAYAVTSLTSSERLLNANSSSISTDGQYNEPRYTRVFARSRKGSFHGLLNSQAEKRRKLSAQDVHVRRPSHPWTNSEASTNGNVNSKPIRLSERSSDSSSHSISASSTTGLRLNANKLPSVQSLNNALKADRAKIPLPTNLLATQPRTLHFGRTQEGGERISPTLVSNTAAITTFSNATLANPVKKSVPTPGNIEEVVVDSEDDAFLRSFPFRTSPFKKALGVTPKEPLNRRSLIKENEMLSPTESKSVASLGKEDRDSVISDLEESSADEITAPNTKNRVHINHIASPSLAQAASSNKSGAFSEEENHLLIFLKEVQRLQWKVITEQFAVHYPGRKYHNLQSHYSSKLNKRDRSKDPSKLRLPSCFASEATIGRAVTHVETYNPTEMQRPNHGGTTSQQAAYRKERLDTSRARFRPQEPLQEISSGTESTRLARRRRSVPIKNYAWPKRYAHSSIDVEVEDEALKHMDATVMDMQLESEKPIEELQLIPEKAIPVDNEPLCMDLENEDALVALSTQPRHPNSSEQKLPYLSLPQRSLVQKTPTDYEWDQLCSREWQGSLIHVDFSPAELEIVERAFCKFLQVRWMPTTNSPRKWLRKSLQKLAEPQFAHLLDDIQGCLRTRDRDCIDAFLQDARIGKIRFGSPRIGRLTAARPDRSYCTDQKASIPSLIRQRELGFQSRRGWSAASTPLPYQMKNKVIDSLGPSLSYIGASSDVHAVAWSIDSQSFAAGAICVDDPHSMQYNRPNNLLYGDIPHKAIHELGRHRVRRPITKSGPNSTQAMYTSQDPQLYKTVSSVTFSPNGRHMFSGGYDKNVCVWETNMDGSQPEWKAALKHEAEVDIMVINQSGCLATASKNGSARAVSVFHINEDDPTIFTQKTFSSRKAETRPDFNILPTALKFSPRYDNLLLAGFGANVRTDGRDVNGDICLWDLNVPSDAPGGMQLNVHGSGKNVFDLAFHLRYPWIAVGCVAGPHANRGAKSIIRLYDEQGVDGRSLSKYSMRAELECKALDMNDVVWCPGDDYLVAAGCTSGRAYVWDVRWPDHFLRELAHGPSLMPLDDYIDHEISDTGVRFLSWGENATRLYTGSSDGVVKVWNVVRSEEETFVKDLVTVNSGIMSGAFSPDGDRLILGEINGSINVLEVGRQDGLLKDADKLEFVPYFDDEKDQPIGFVDVESGLAHANELLTSGQIIQVPMGGLPIRQAVQGPNYTGPYDKGVDVPFLREQALRFQNNLSFKPAPQCSIPFCSDTFSKTTGEEIGDSGRSTDRIPDELRKQWQLIDPHPASVNGKLQCTSCGRLARASASTALSMLCERCSFACFRCGAINQIEPATETLRCGTCDRAWDIGVLGYACLKESDSRVDVSGVPPLQEYGKSRFIEKLLSHNQPDDDASFGDEMNALTDYYFSLAIDRPESPPL